LLDQEVAPRAGVAWRFGAHGDEPNGPPADSIAPRMRIEGTREFEAPPEAVFDALTDPDLVSRAIPALESLDISDPDHWTATVKVSIAPRLKVRFEVLDKRPPAHARLRAHGKNLGGAATVDTSFDLAGSNGRTTMRYDA